MARYPQNVSTVVWKEGKHYVAQCLSVDVSTFGETKKEALAHMDEALSLYFEDSAVEAPRKIEKPEIVSLRLLHA